MRCRPLYVDSEGVNLWNTNFSVVEVSTVVRQRDTVLAHLLNGLRTHQAPLPQHDIDLLKGRETGEQSSALHVSHK